jgi:nucleotide-binding universal stress UspA family protein
MFRLQRILLPVDFSERCHQAIRYALPPLAKHFGCEIIVCHVLTPFLEFGSPELGISLSGEYMVERRKTAKAQLEAFLADELREFKVTRVLLEGDPARKIVEQAQSAGCDLILLPTHGYGPFRRMLLGSVTSKVLHDAECPVWTGTHFQPKSPTEPIQLSHILCAIDLGPHSSRTLDWASQLTIEFNAKLTLVHVITALNPRTEDYYFAPEWRKYLIDRARTDLEALQQAAGSKAEVELEMGDVAQAVCAAAELNQAELIVVGRGSIVSTLGRFRTHAYTIIRESPCPVVSV